MSNNNSNNNNNNNFVARQSASHWLRGLMILWRHVLCKIAIFFWFLNSLGII